MMKRPGFTLIEVLMAFALSAYIMYGLTRLYQTVVRQVAFTRNITQMQRGVFLVLYQMRADLGAAFVPETLPPEDKDDAKKEGANVQDTTAQDQPSAAAPVDASKAEKDAERLKERYKNMFLLSVEENDEPVKIEGELRHMVKKLSFVTTNPLHLYDQRRQRIVRVIYEIVRDKAASKREHDVYSLVRKELLDIMDFNGKDAEQSFVVAQNLKGFFVECSMFKKDIPPKKAAKDEANKNVPQAEEKEIDPKERVVAKAWGDTQELQGFVPESVTCWLEFWDGDTEQKLLFNQSMAISAYPSRRGAQVQPAPEQAPGADKPADGQPPQDKPPLEVVAGVGSIAGMPGTPPPPVGSKG